MGLDMYLEGERYLTGVHTEKHKRVVNGYPLKKEILELGYWRKHPDLHGFIVQTFAEGVDECQEIGLDEDALLKTLEAVKDGELPHTEGFFFGASTEEDRADSIKILEAAIQWLRDEKSELEVWRSVVYRASW